MAINANTSDAWAHWSLPFAASNFPTDGQYIVRAVPQDFAINAPSGPSVTFIRDTAAPTAPVVAGIAADTGWSATDGITSDRTLVLNGTAEGGSTVTITRVGVGVIGSATANASGNWSFDYSAVTLDPGQYPFTATASDAAGNVSAGSGPLNVTIDTAAPSASIIAFPSAGAYNLAGWAGTIGGSAGDNPGGAGLKQVQVSIKNATTNRWWNAGSFSSPTEVFQTATGTTAWSLNFAASNLAHGSSYTVHALATDHAGNAEAGPTASFTYDTAAPTISGVGASNARSRPTAIPSGIPPAWRTPSRRAPR